MSQQAANHRQRLGFRDGDRGTHSSRTMMLAELTTLLAAAPPSADRARARELVVDENLLGKRSAGNRQSSFQRLSELYALDPVVPIYRVLRRLWDDDPEGRPLLALLCAVARDPLLRADDEVVLDVAVGATVTPDVLGATVHRPLATTTRKSIGQNLASSWAQAGFLAGIVAKTRARAQAAGADEETVVGVLGVASLFGFAQVSDLVPRIVPHLPGRLLVFFPGSREGNVYKLLDAREGWNYLATPITPFDDGTTP